MTCAAAAAAAAAQYFSADHIKDYDKGEICGTGGGKKTERRKN